MHNDIMQIERIAAPRGQKTLLEINFFLKNMNGEDVNLALQIAPKNVKSKQGYLPQEEWKKPKMECTN